MKFRIVAMLALLLPCASALAANSMNVSQELDTEYSYVGGANIRGDKQNTGNAAENSGDFKYVLCPQINKDLIGRFGFEYQSFSFGVPQQSVVPKNLIQASAVIGFDYQVPDEWLLRVELEPGIYSDFRDISWRDVDMPLLIGGAYLANPDLQWLFGMRVDVRSDFPVLPAIGIRWKYSDQWTLNLMAPKPRIEYDVNQRLQLHAGAEFLVGTFAVGENFGTPRGEPRLDGKIVDYLEIRFGSGLSWKLTPNITVDAEAGLVPYRWFDFDGPNINFRSHNAPYGELALHGRF
jgi:hypothetical protein